MCSSLGEKEASGSTQLGPFSFPTLPSIDTTNETQRWSFTEMRCPKCNAVFVCGHFLRSNGNHLGTSRE